MSNLVYSKEVENMCCVAKGPNHGPAPIPEEGKWVQAKQITDISAYTHGVGWLFLGSPSSNAKVMWPASKYFFAMR